MNVFHKYTLQNLKKNKTRTIVTIIGIILSVAMFSATILSLTSAMHYMTSYVEQTIGKFYCELSDVNEQTANEIKNDKRVKTFSQMKTVGYAEIGSKNAPKPYSIMRNSSVPAFPLYRSKSIFGKGEAHFSFF